MLKDSNGTVDTKDAKLKAAMREFMKIEKEREANGEFETVGSFGLTGMEIKEDGTTVHTEVVKVKVAQVVEEAIAQVSSEDEEDGHIPLVEDVLPADMPYSKARLDVMVAYSNEYDPGDAGNAQRFRRLFGDSYRYIAQRKSWFFYNGKKWAKCDNGEAETAMIDTVSAIKYEIRQAKKRAEGEVKGSFRELFLRKLERHYCASMQAVKIASALTFAKNMSCFKMRHEDLDGPSSDYLFNVGNGTIDLRTGQLRAWDKEDFIGRITPVPMAATSDCPKFKEFMLGVFQGSQALVDYCLKVMGAAMLGIRKKKEEFYLLLGLKGSNGKTTVMKTMAHAFFEYSVECDPYTWIAKKDKNSAAASPDVARLDNARLVLVAELPPNEMFDESRIKAWTGGDPIIARFLNENPIVVRSNGTLMLSSNHRPKINLADSSMWRRNKALPFYARFGNDSTNMEGSTAAANLNLQEELDAELPQILRLLVEKCMEYQRDGIQEVPAEVAQCLEDYKASFDTVGDFVREECTIEASNVVTPTTELYKKYDKWAREEQGQTKVMIRKNFVESLSRLGYKEGDPSKYQNRKVIVGLSCDLKF